MLFIGLSQFSVYRDNAAESVVLGTGCTSGQVRLEILKSGPACDWFVVDIATLNNKNELNMPPEVPIILAWDYCFLVD